MRHSLRFLAVTTGLLLTTSGMAHIAHNAAKSHRSKNTLSNAQTTVANQATGWTYDEDTGIYSKTITDSNGNDHTVTFEPSTADKAQAAQKILQASETAAVITAQQNGVTAADIQSGIQSLLDTNGTYTISKQDILEANTSAKVAKLLAKALVIENSPYASKAAQTKAIKKLARHIKHAIKKLEKKQGKVTLADTFQANVDDGTISTAQAEELIKILKARVKDLTKEHKKSLKSAIKTDIEQVSDEFKDTVESKLQAAKKDAKHDVRVNLRAAGYSKEDASDMQSAINKAAKKTGYKSALKTAFQVDAQEAKANLQHDLKKIKWNNKKYVTGQKEDLIETLQADPSAIDNFSPDKQAIAKQKQTIKHKTKKAIKAEKKAFKAAIKADAKETRKTYKSDMADYISGGNTNISNADAIAAMKIARQALKATIKDEVRPQLKVESKAAKKDLKKLIKQDVANEKQDIQTQSKKKQQQLQLASTVYNARQTADSKDGPIAQHVIKKAKHKKNEAKRKNKKELRKAIRSDAKKVSHQFKNDVKQDVAYVKSTEKQNAYQYMIDNTPDNISDDADAAFALRKIKKAVKANIGKEAKPQIKAAVKDAKRSLRKGVKQDVTEWKHTYKKAKRTTRKNIADGTWTATGDNVGEGIVVRKDAATTTLKKAVKATAKAEKKALKKSTKAILKATKTENKSDVYQAVEDDLNVSHWKAKKAVGAAKQFTKDVTKTILKPMIDEDAQSAKKQLKKMVQRDLKQQKRSIKQQLEQLKRHMTLAQHLGQMHRDSKDPEVDLDHNNNFDHAVDVHNTEEDHAASRYARCFFDTNGGKHCDKS